MLQRYYVQYLKGFDLAELNEFVSGLPELGEDDSTILNNISQTLDDLSVRQVEEGAAFDFTGLRLDWVRLQVGYQHSLFISCYHVVGTAVPCRIFKSYQERILDCFDWLFY